MTKFHARLNLLKNLKEVTQKQIADAVGVSERSVSYYLANTEPKYEVLCKLANYFNVSTDYLLGNEINVDNHNANLIKENEYLKLKLKRIDGIVREIKEL